jgi:hypothetical protein
MELYNAGDPPSGLWDKENENPDICRARYYSFARNQLVLTSIKGREKREKNEN